MHEEVNKHDGDEKHNGLRHAYISTAIMDSIINLEMERKNTSKSEKKSVSLCPVIQPVMTSKGMTKDAICYMNKQKPHVSSIKVGKRR